MSARDVVLKAKTLLREIPDAAVLSRDAFITVCVEASLAFLREGIQSDSRNSYTSHSCSVPSDYNTPDKVTSSNGMIPSEHEVFVPRLVNIDVERLRACVAAELRRVCPARPIPSDGTDAQESFTLPRAKVEAADVIKRVLDEPYRRNEITRHQYSVIVLAVLEKLFPDLVAATDRMMCGNDESEASSGSEVIVVDPPQDPHAALREDVAAVAVQLAERALQHYTAGHAFDGMAERGNDETLYESELRVGALGESPVPRDPNSAEEVLEVTFERQVERLRRVLEEKFSLDLSGGGCLGSPHQSQDISPNGRNGHSGGGGGGGDREEHAESERRDYLLSEAQRCHEELQVTQERLTGIMNELRSAETPATAISG